MAQEPDLPNLTPERTVHQIFSADGTPYQSHATDPVWVTKSDPYEITDGNDVWPLVTGERYFKELAAAIGQAEKSIYMLGWQINWDVMLQPGLRLYDALLGAARAKPKLKIFVLPWSGSSYVPTYVAETVRVLNLINDDLGAKTSGAKRVFTTGADAHPNPSAGLESFFSHHQKLVVIDERIAFIGGIDVAYGRRDDAGFDLDAAERHGNDSYNGCLPHLRAVEPAGYVDCVRLDQPDTISTIDGSLTNTPAVQAKAALHAGKVQYPADGVEIDATRQPRMPWQDVHLKIEGPAASDLASNFVLRWNSANSTPRLMLPAKPAIYAKRGGCQVQMLRSASGKMVELEARSVSKDDRSRVHTKYWHNHIHHAMVGLIEKADHFIYIENQFFVSAFGRERFGDGVGETSKSAAIKAARSAFKGMLTRAAWGDATALPKNLVCEALGAKLRSVIMNGSNPAPDGKTSRFHIYITLPVHPEGMLNDPSVMTQVHYTMQSLVFGEQSLINRTRRAILARKLLEQLDQGYERVFKDGNYEYENVPIEDCWPYLTLLNLRNWAQLGDRYVTEQIYVHTKMMIVDDRYALVGSANINDRSQLGNRDSELAVLVMDTDYSTQDVGAFDGPQVTRKFARELRMKVWSKLFCLDGARASVKPASGLADAVRRPAAQASWEAIRERAAKNTSFYDAAFAFIPRNPTGSKMDERTWSSQDVSVWPTKVMDGKLRPSGLMPFDKAFWAAPRHAAAAEELHDIQGFVTVLPWLWTQGEDNNSGYHSSLYVENETKPAAKAKPVEFAAASPTQRKALDDESEVTI